MKLKTKILWIIYLVVVIFWGYFTAQIQSKGSNPPSASIRSSKLKFCFEEELTFEPKTITWGESQIAIDEVWLERNNQTAFVIAPIPGILAGIPIYKKLDGYLLCFTISNGKNVFWHTTSDGKPAHFRIAGKRNSFSMCANRFSEHIDTDQFSDITIYLTDNKHLTTAVKCKITKEI